MFMKKRINKKGFSLVELLAVVVILGLIAAIGIGATAYLSDLAKKNKMKMLIKNSSRGRTPPSSTQGSKRDSRLILVNTMGLAHTVPIPSSSTPKLLTQHLA